MPAELPADAAVLNQGSWRDDGLAALLGARAALRAETGAARRAGAGHNTAAAAAAAAAPRRRRGALANAPSVPRGAGGPSG